MAVTLTKIIGREPVVSDTLTNALTVRCSRCAQTYRLGYSDDERNKLRTWQQLARKALRKDHDLRHEMASIPLAWIHDLRFNRWSS